jgi:hypothetical protein
MKNTPYSLRCGGVFILALLPGATILRAAILFELHRLRFPHFTGSKNKAAQGKTPIVIRRHYSWMLSHPYMKRKVNGFATLNIDPLATRKLTPLPLFFTGRIFPNTPTEKSPFDGNDQSGWNLKQGK